MDRVHRMELQYDGTGLHGWAKQEGVPTVEASLEGALRTVLGRTPGLRVAGRTDAGVHARRQVVSLALPAGLDLGRLVHSLNALTPPGVVVTRLAPARAGFDARADAVSRTYRYYLSTLPVVPPFWSHFCWRPPGELNTGLLQASAAVVAGRHDFTAFTPAETEHVFFRRTVLRCAWKRTRHDLADSPLAVRPGTREGTGGGQAGRGAHQGLLYLEIEADAFLRHMVRTLVGTMVEVAQEKRSLEDLERLLVGGAREEAGPTAPAQGLFLWDVRFASRRRAGPDRTLVE